MYLTNLIYDKNYKAIASYLRHNPNEREFL